MGPLNCNGIFGSSNSLGDCRKDVETPVIGANLIKEALWVVPLVQQCFNEVLSAFKPEPNRSFVSLSARITLHIQVHQFHYRSKCGTKPMLPVWSGG